MTGDSLDRFAVDRLTRLTRKGQKRSLQDTGRRSAIHLNRDGHELISFCCNDYLGLTHHPRLVKAAMSAIRDYGVGAGASRYVTGNHPYYTRLENRLADMKGTEDAVVFGSGFLANIGVIPALAGPGDLVLVDALSHASIHMGARASGADIRVFAHNDVNDCESILESVRDGYRHCLVMTEGVFSMDGDRAPLEGLSLVCTARDAWLLVDDAHGFGVLGNGRGTAFEYDPHPEIPLQIGTLSKAVGVYGAFLCASRAVIDMIRNRARSLIYTTGLPPATVAACIEGLDIILTEPERVARPMQLARRFCEGLGLAEPESPIVPIVTGSEERAMAAAAALERAGFLVTPIRPPTVPAGTSRLRFTFTSAHGDDEVDLLVEQVREILPRSHG